MKIIISHDVDHLYLKDHYRDTFIPGSLYRSTKDLFNGNITLPVLFKRFPRKLNRVKELHEFNKKAGIKETFFFGMRKGLNLSYNWTDAAPLVEYLLSENVLVGMHGMGYNSYELLKEEKGRLDTMLPPNYPLGIRNHYLRMDENTLKNIDRNGFLFDSTHYKIQQPFKHGNLWEIPISIMDAGFVSNDKNGFEDLKRRTLLKIDSAEKNDLPFFVINFHDVYFSDAFLPYRQWYEWLILYLCEHKYGFINFFQAVQILNKQGDHENSLHQ